MKIKKDIFFGIFMLKYWHRSKVFLYCFLKVKNNFMKGEKGNGINQSYVSFNGRSSEVCTSY